MLYVDFGGEAARPVLVSRPVVLGERVGEGATKTNIETELKTSNNAGDQTLVRVIC